MTHIVVLGGGYAGLLAAKLTAKRTNARVTLINAGDRFVERVRLHQLASGQALRELPLAGLLRGTGVELVVGKVIGIDAENRVVRLHGIPETVGYDALFYALGSRADLDSVPGAAEHAHTVADAASAARLRERVREGGVVAVVGGGLTGIETATELAETMPGLKVRLVTGGRFGAAFSENGRRYLRRAFARLGIEVTDQVRVGEVQADGVRLSDGGHVAADTVIWTTGFRVPELARDAGFAVDPAGRMIVDETLRSVSHPEVYAIGDAAAARRPDGQELRMACATGLPTAAQAVGAFADRLAGRDPKPLRFRYFTQCVSLGRHDGLIQFVSADDSPVGTVLTGRVAALVKESIVRGTVSLERHPVLAKLVS
ncbi:NAD(P)/FAD-dependent oxidoreductase [Amycolatopsis pigmentata]|uniref:NAD(P)/FAD-dependent oxidoreductase n=1 Tax=Amycolatopsis pigmentata TaxID=450801 RepID=A0ABW5G6Z9_9PSEU